MRFIWQMWLYCAAHGKRLLFLRKFPWWVWYALRLRTLEKRIAKAQDKMCVLK